MSCPAHTDGGSSPDLDVAELYERIAAVDAELEDPSLDDDRRQDLLWERADLTEAIVGLEHYGDAAESMAPFRTSILSAKLRRQQRRAESRRRIHLDGHARMLARTAPRARGAGRPAARPAARGGDSGDSSDDGLADPADEPPPARPDGRALRRSRGPPRSFPCALSGPVCALRGQNDQRPRVERAPGDDAK